MRTIMHGAFLLAFSILQSTLLNSVVIFSVKPNLFLVYVIIICCFCSRVEGAVLGFVSGIILDILIGRFWGMNAILGMLAGFFIANFCERVLRKKNVLIILLIVLLCSFMYESIYYFISYLFSENLNFKTAVFRIIFPESIYNAAAAVPIYFAAIRFIKRLYIDKGENIG